jgi:hypothetical protein
MCLYNSSLRHYVMPSCSCPRCVCKDLPLGEFMCEEVPADQCKVAGEPNPGGCWKEGEFSACFDNIAAKKDAGLKGLDPSSVPAVVGGLYKSNPVVTHSLKAPGFFNPCDYKKNPRLKRKISSRMK